jgi:glycerol kinase
MIQKKTGLVLDAYFSGTKVKWILDNVPGAREKQSKESYVWNCRHLVNLETNTRQNVHDRCLCKQNLIIKHSHIEWDTELLELFNIPRAMLPEVKQSSEIYGETCTTLFSTKSQLQVSGDQQAARTIMH